MLEDDLSAPAADHSRITWVNAIDFDGTYAGQLYYDFGSVDQEWYNQGGDSGTLFLEPGESSSWAYPNAAEPIWIFGQWGVPTDLAQTALEVDAFIQVGNNQNVTVYLTCTGACGVDDAFVLGQFEDGSTATTEGCKVYDSSTGALEIRDCE